MSRRSAQSSPPVDNPGLLKNWLIQLAARVDTLEGSKGGELAAILRAEAGRLVGTSQSTGQGNGGKGEPFRYEDFTPEQLEALRGPPGPPGFTYDDFTPAQLAELKGSPFTYADFTLAQLAALKGDAFTYADFTPTQLAALKGEPGAAGGAATVSLTAPSSPANGDKWVRLPDLIEFTFIDDGVSAAWVEL